MYENGQFSDFVVTILEASQDGSNEGLVIRISLEEPY